MLVSRSISEIYQSNCRICDTNRLLILILLDFPSFFLGIVCWLSFTNCIVYVRSHFDFTSYINEKWIRSIKMNDFMHLEWSRLGTVRQNRAAAWDVHPNSQVQFYVLCLRYMSQPALPRHGLSNSFPHVRRMAPIPHEVRHKVFKHPTIVNFFVSPFDLSQFVVLFFQFVTQDVLFTWKNETICRFH